MAGEATADRPKKHSSFMQVILRKSGEALDLAGKGLLGLSGLGHLLRDHAASNPGRGWLVAEILVGGAALVVGIYLQAKAEETTP